MLGSVLGYVGFSVRLRYVVAGEARNLLRRQQWHGHNEGAARVVVCFHEIRSRESPLHNLTWHVTLPNGLKVTRDRAPCREGVRTVLNG